MGKEIAQAGQPDGDPCFQARLLFGCGSDWRELPPLSRVRCSSERRTMQTSIRGEAVDGSNGDRRCQDLQEGRAATQPLFEEERKVDGIGAVGLGVQWPRHLPAEFEQLDMAARHFMSSVRGPMFKLASTHAFEKSP